MNVISDHHVGVMILGLARGRNKCRQILWRGHCRYLLKTSKWCGSWCFSQWPYLSIILSNVGSVWSWFVLRSIANIHLVLISQAIVVLGSKNLNDILFQSTPSYWKLCDHSTTQGVETNCVLLLCVACIIHSFLTSIHWFVHHLKWI